MNGNNRKLNLTSTIALLVTGMIGSAIFSLSGLTISYAGPAALLSWIIAAIIQLVYGLSMAELAIKYKKNGGLFVFPERSFKKNGRLVGFLSTWGNYFTDVVSVAFSAIYITIYLSASFPDVAKYGFLISVLSILICFYINYVKIKNTGKISFILGVILAILLLVYSITIITNGAIDPIKFIPFFSQGEYGKLGFLKAVPIAIIGYSSIMSISFMVDEIENEKRNIPFAVCIGMFIVLVIYTLVIFSTVGCITSKELINQDMVYIPLFAVCFNKFPFLAKFISIAAVIALITTMVVVIAMNGRNIKTVADAGLLPKFLSKNGKNNTPIFAMATTCILAAILCYFKELTELIVNLAALFSIVTISINLLSSIFTRLKENKSTFILKLMILIMVLCYTPDILKGGISIWVISITWYIIGLIVYKKYAK